jgi:lipopolysaccharide assembly outer membrane protein LptD (OstA)
VSLAAPALAQQPAAPDPTEKPSALGILAAALEARAGLQRIALTHWKLTERVDIPIGSGQRIFADDVDLFFDQEVLVATGNVAFTTPEGRVSAEKIEFNFVDGSAVFYQAVGILSLGATANPAEFGNQDPDVYFWGARIDKLSAKKYRITGGGFTACVQPTPRWEVSSKIITLNLDDYAVARGTVLRVKGVPLVYLPVIYYPLQEDQRSTGFLMPTYGTSTVRGGSLSNAFFWAIGRSQDATFYHDWFTRTGTGVGGEYRYVSGGQSSGILRFYRFSQKETQLEGSTTPLPAKTSYQINAAVNQDIGRLKGQGTVEYFTDVETQQIYHQNPTLRTQSRRTVAGGINGTFGPATLASYFLRSEQFTDSRNSTVYGSLPRATAIVTPTRLFGAPVYAGVTGEYAFIPSQRLLDGQVVSDSTLGRLDLAPSIRAPLSRLSFLSVNTSAAYRQNYEWPRVTDPTAAPVLRGLKRQDFSLQTDIVGPVFSKIWDTPGSTYSERMKHVIEPAFSVNYVTEVNARTPLVTTPTAVQASKASTRLTYGLTNRLFARAPLVDGVGGGTREFLTIGIQQTYYTDPETSRIDSTYVSYSGRPKPVELSPVALTARFSPAAILDANARIEYDVSGNGFQIFSAGSTLASATKTANISFSRQRFTPTGPVSSYLSGSTSMRFMQNRTSLLYAVNWNIDAQYIYSQSVGASYLAQCCGVQADFQIVNYAPAVRSAVPQDRRFNFAFVLAGLGTFSNFFGFFGGQQ